MRRRRHSVGADGVRRFADGPRSSMNYFGTTISARLFAVFNEFLGLKNDELFQKYAKRIQSVSSRRSPPRLGRRTCTNMAKDKRFNSSQRNGLPLLLSGKDFAAFTVHTYRTPSRVPV